jgi:hypothetical protein
MTTDITGDQGLLPSHYYEPLDRARKSIRLLQVLPGDQEDSIHCKLHYCDLDAKPEYQALSYMWDRGRDEKRLHCDGKAIVIGRNLWRFLHEYRKTRKTTWLWIDALCINQGDLQERNHQVGQMRKIYVEATSVIIWLGEADEKDKDAFGQLKAGQVEENESWSSLFSKPYWRRIWIVQEVIVAQEAHIWCGSLQANAREFAQLTKGIKMRNKPGWRLLRLREQWHSQGTSTYSAAPTWYSLGPSTLIASRVPQLNDIAPKPDALRLIAASQGLTVKNLTTPFSFHNLSTTFAKSHSSNERDFVYALRGIAADLATRKDILVPDYSKTPIEVLVEVIRSLNQLEIPKIGASKKRKLSGSLKSSNDKNNSGEWDESKKFIQHLAMKLGRLDIEKAYQLASIPPPEVKRSLTEVICWLICLWVCCLIGQAGVVGMLADLLSIPTAWVMKLPTGK